MNQLTQAFLASGVKLPTQYERLWRMVKDHPGLTSCRLARLTQIPKTSAASGLSDMTKRGMLVATPERGRVMRGKVVVNRIIFSYTVHPRMNGEYEMLPMPAAPKKEKSKVVSLHEGSSYSMANFEQDMDALLGPLTAKAPKPAVISKPEPPPADPGINIDHLTLSQARRLYSELHQLFGK